MSGQASCEDLPSATFSPASADGPLPWPLPDGRWIDPCGLALALASLSARQVAAMGLQISGISGRPGSTSSASAALSASLANRLQAQLDTGGSILYRQTWRQRTTPSGVPYWEHTASALHPSETGFSSWPRPTAQDAHGRDRHNQMNGSVILSFLGISRLHTGLTDEKGQLTPDHTAWVMGFPREWHLIAPTETRSSRKRQRRSSGRSSNQVKT